MDSITVNIPSEDFTTDGPIRLKDFADIQIHHDTDSRGEVIRTERVGNTPIIHWLPENMATPATLILEEEGELVFASGLLETNSYPEGTVVQLERMGFAILEGLDENGVRTMVRLHG